MTAAYIDTSVVMRIVLGQPEPLKEWNNLDLGISNELLRVECFRTLDRMWRQQTLNDAQLEQKRSDVETIVSHIEIVPFSKRIFDIAAQAFPTVIATLDALHLATAILYRSSQQLDERPIVMATHDRALAKAATALHFEVIGA